MPFLTPTLLLAPIPRKQQYLYFKFLLAFTRTFSIYRSNTLKFSSTMVPRCTNIYVTNLFCRKKNLPFGTFVLKRLFIHVHVSEKLQPFGSAHIIFLEVLFGVTYDFRSLDGTAFKTHRNLNLLLRS